MTAETLPNGLVSSEDGIPVYVWVVEYVDFAQHRALAVAPYDALVPDLVWALVEANFVAETLNGVCVNFCRGGTAWFPYNNVRFGDAPDLRVQLTVRSC